MNSQNNKKRGDGSIKPSLDIFMILGNILVDKDQTLYELHTKNDAFPQVFSAFMILRYLTMNSNPIVRSIVIDNLTTLEGMAERPETLYKFLMKIIPKTYNRFTPYIKSGFPRAN